MTLRFLLAGAILFYAAASLPAQSLITAQDNGGSAFINTYTSAGASAGSFQGAGLAFNGGLRIGVGDVDGDGAVDILTGEGAGGSTVRIYSGPSHTLTMAVGPFGGGYTAGVYVSAGDINHDGRADIIAGAGAGGSPLVKVISGVDGTTALASFSAFNTAFTGGVRVASGDVNHDGFADIITGSGSGAGEIKVFSGKDLTVLASFMPFAAGYTGGLNVGAGDLNGDGFADIIIGSGTGIGQIKTYSGKDMVVLNNFFPFGVSFNGEVRVGGADLDGDGLADLVAGEGPGGGSIVSTFNGLTSAAMASFQPYGPSTVGVFVGAVPEPDAWVWVMLGAVATGAALRRARLQI